MGPDYAISVMSVKTAEFDSTIKPQFKKSPKGLLLSSYQAKPPSTNQFFFPRLF
jgi:hypothetical protein